MDDTLKAALAAAHVLDELGVRWFLGGSLASSVHGIPRATLDADIMDAINQRSSFNLIHFATAMKVDVFLPKPRRFDGGEFARSRKMPVAEGSRVEASVCCAEDIVIAKLEWYRLGGEDSERQWQDVLGVLRLNSGRLDIDLLRQSADEVGVSDLLQRALDLAEAG